MWKKGVKVGNYSASGMTLGKCNNSKCWVYQFPVSARILWLLSPLLITPSSTTNYEWRHIATAPWSEESWWCRSSEPYGDNHSRLWWRQEPEERFHMSPRSAVEGDEIFSGLSFHWYTEMGGCRHICALRYQDIRLAHTVSNWVSEKILLLWPDPDSTKSYFRPKNFCLEFFQSF